MQLYTIACIIRKEIVEVIFMIIALAEYARLHNRSGDTLRRLAENGSLKTAQKSEEIGQLIAKKSIRQKEK